MVLGVQVHPVEVIQTWDLLVGVHSCQNAANICLGEERRHWALLQSVKLFCFVLIGTGGWECGFVLRILFTKLKKTMLKTVTISY